jgi:hypothetical protein
MIKSNAKARFQLKLNVKYELVNLITLTDLLKTVNIAVAYSPELDLNMVRAEALKQGISEKQLNSFVKLSTRQIFSENKLGSFILNQFRKYVKNPIGVDGKVKEGWLNYLSAYGLRVPLLTGNYLDARVISNLTTTTGKAGVASRINGSGGEAAFTYIGLGTGTTAAAIGDTTLETELAVSGLGRANSTASRVTTDTTNDTAQLVNTFTVSGTAAVTESGVLNASSNGVLLARQVFSAINVVNGDSLQITWKFDVD